MKFGTITLMVGLITPSATALASETITYTYDAKGRIMQVTHSGTVNGSLQTTYSHDHADNRTHVTVTGGH